MRADRVPGGGNLLEDAGLVGGVQADREEDRLGAVRGERGEHRRRVLRPGAVVEGENDLAFAQEVVGLEVLEAEAGAAGGVDFDHPRDTDGIGIAARGRHGGGQRCGLRGGRRLSGGGRRRLSHGNRRGHRAVGRTIRNRRDGAGSPAFGGGRLCLCGRGRGRRRRNGGFLEENGAKYRHAQHNRQRGRNCCQTHVRPPNPRGAPLIRYRPSFGPYPLIQP